MGGWEGSRKDPHERNRRETSTDLAGDKYLRTEQGSLLLPLTGGNGSAPMGRIKTSVPSVLAG